MKKRLVLLHRTFSLTRRPGFTLLEAIVAATLLAMIAAGAFLMLSATTTAYSKTGAVSGPEEEAALVGRLLKDVLFSARILKGPATQTQCQFLCAKGQDTASPGLKLIRLRKTSEGRPGLALDEKPELATDDFTNPTRLFDATVVSFRYLIEKSGGVSWVEEIPAANETYEQEVPLALEISWQSGENTTPKTLTIHLPTR